MRVRGAGRRRDAKERTNLGTVDPVIEKQNT